MFTPKHSRKVARLTLINVALHQSCGSWSDVALHQSCGSLGDGLIIVLISKLGPFGFVRFIYSMMEYDEVINSDTKIYFLR